ncbi:TIM barrel protein [Glaciimonas sp. CA11.2]|uniref:sugar phosphate isomerase/epimerase family protein n=1 Tax=Glaciimonas sp. CA11.2 TaxID=3048601 RepID=UPI002AB526F5|nr:TIM barrel protein [Glaciimonas sp. CA11.2]MDY7546159.1 TIM barrel protein [Glaciimonas sp. CA11.2]MEB0161581.1 TIM barrel protein [Glaciimonas sp. CA11.2]
MPLPKIVIVASSFGIESVIKQGHATLVPLAVAAGADGIEIRRELFHDAVCHSVDALQALAKTLNSQQLLAVYSAPTPLFLDDGALNLDALSDLLREAEALNASSLKLQLGHFAGDVDVSALRATLAASNVALLVENGQLQTGGRIADFTNFFAICSMAKLPVGMTFDIGNWIWAGEDPLRAAQQLTPYVHYIHCKGVEGEGMRRFAAAPNEDTLAYWRKCLAVLPKTVPRGIEYPLPDQGIGPAAKQHVAQLRSV